MTWRVDSYSDPNAGSLVLFKRYGCPVDSASHASRRWELGRVVNTFFVDDERGSVTAAEQRILDGHCTAWLTIDPEKSEGRSAPTTLTVPLDLDHVDPIVHGTDLDGRAGGGR